MTIDLRKHGAEIEDFLDEKVFEASKDEPTIEAEKLFAKLDRHFSI